jgi:hypothetical protein
MTFDKFLSDYELWIEYIILIILAIFLIPLMYIYIKLFYPSFNNDLVNAYMSLAAGLFSGIITGMFVAKRMITETFDKNYDLKFQKIHTRLKKEIFCNKKKFDQFNSDVSAIENIWLNRSNRDEKWLPKYPSIRPSSKYLKEYLSTKAYHYFLTLEDFEFEQGRLERICNFYYYCIKFSDQTQAIEDEIDEYRKTFTINNNEEDQKYGNFILLKIDEMYELFKYYNSCINENYDNLDVRDKFSDNELLKINCL